MTASESVWCVWTEWGEYEQFSRDLRACFATAELAEQHAERLRTKEKNHYDLVEVVREPVLSELPADVPFIEWSAHINPDGTEDRGLGFSRGVKFRTWSNEIDAVSGRLDKWSSKDTPDLYIEVSGCDGQAVATEYRRLLAQAREQLQRRYL